MTKHQKWAIVGAIWVGAIGIFLSAFRGRYQRLEPLYGGPRKFDTWTGERYEYDIGSNHWVRVFLGTEKEK